MGGLKLPVADKHDNLISDTTRILVGETALYRAGLTTLFTGILQVSTLDVTFRTPLISGYIQYCFNPFADKYFDTTPSASNSLLLIPTQERAICEYIILRDYFDEGILIEAIQSYLQYNKELNELHEAAHRLHLRDNILDYWIEEAINDGKEG